MTVLPFIKKFNKMLLAHFVCLALFSAASAMYSTNSEVIELTDANFNKLVTLSDEVWVVEFYAPWCGHCQRLAPEYTKAAKGLKGVVKVGGINCDVEKSLPGRFGVRGFPTIKIFGANKNTPDEFNGERTAEGIVNAALSAVKKKVNIAMGMKADSDKKKTGDSKDVVELTDSNFDTLVLKSDDMWLVEFYAPWCGHCKNLAPQWEEAATELKGKVKLGALDATIHTIKANEYSVKGYPTIKFFPPGKKDKSSAEDFMGDRTSSFIVTWALDKLAENVPPPEIKQIVNTASLKEACEEKPLCVISVLPHILDCNAACRNDYINILTTAGEKYKNKLWGWIWSEAGQQPELESSLDIGGFGYPAMAVLNAKKMKYSLFKGAFSKDGINEFLRDLSYGRGSTAPVRGAKLPEIHDHTPWDGKDGELPQEEDIDLSDIDLGEDPKDEL